MRVLALDLSTHVGWCFYASRTAAPAFNTWHAPRAVGETSNHFGPIFHDFEGWLNDRISEFQPELVAFEAPILPRNRVFQKQRAIRLSYGFAEITERVAFQRFKRCVECAPATVKKRLAGHGTARKHHMIAACARLGFEVATDHEADAIGVALVAYDHVEPAQAEMALP